MTPQPPDSRLLKLVMERDELRKLLTREKMRASKLRVMLDQATGKTRTADAAKTRQPSGGSAWE